jgi:octaprenyl-diphosphate synthase
MNAAFAESLTEAGVQKAFERVADELRAVEAELEQQVLSQVDLVKQVGELTLKGGGKRLRPALVTLTAMAIGRPFDVERTRKLGACMELIHMATLIHDDVIDHAAVRRGRPTASATFGNTASILSGDVLLAKAMRLLALDGDLDIIRTVSSVVVDLAEGEVMELELRGRVDVSESEHREVLRRKTATFIEACCEVGALCAGASEEERTAVKRFGFHIGLAFQIVDDLLDYQGDHVKMGKPHATDFREGCATLPLIHLWPHLSAEESTHVSKKFGNGVTDAELCQIVQWMIERGSFAQTQRAADFEIASAKQALSELPGSAERALLELVADFVLGRAA